MLYFALSIFLSAFLLFQIQPMIAKYLLPWFGGTPAVWSTVQLFFQTLLVGGYAYAHWLAKGKSRRREYVHLALLILVGIQMLILGWLWASPVTPDAAWKPHGEVNPIWEIFKLLTISVGPAYFVLSTNSPLMQAWFSRTSRGRSPYVLYALSNIGSLLGLVTYPIFVEPRLDVPMQGILWSVGFGLFALTAAFLAVRTARSQAVEAEATDPARETGASPSAGSRVLWILLSACASVLLLAMTSHITQEVAVIPFLWVLPLTIYLLTFILAFSSEKWYSRQIFLVLLFLVSLAFVAVLYRGPVMTVPLQLAIYSVTLFVVCMVCHGELFRLRPDPAHLTTYYLMVSVGGALGGVFVNFIAPNIFNGFWELPLGFVSAWLLLLVLMVSRPQPARTRALRLTNSVLVMSGFVLTSVWMIIYIQQMSVGALFADRNFYGVVRVVGSQVPGTDMKKVSLVHGITVHGLQVKDESMRHTALAYYYEETGLGLALMNHPRRGQGMRVGILGLGAGIAATYGQPGDTYRFYEINPLVIDLAKGQGGYFTFLSDSPASVEVVPGDARISLEQELAAGYPQNFDVLVLDVFSSDSIPVHLLDKEAFAVYLQHLNPEGILAVHITNTFLDLKPVVFRLAQEYNLTMLTVQSKGDGKMRFAARWVLLARDPAVIEQPAILRYADTMEGYSTNIQLWTDNYSNLFQILIRH